MVERSRWTRRPRAGSYQETRDPMMQVRFLHDPRRRPECLGVTWIKGPSWSAQDVPSSPQRGLSPLTLSLGVKVRGAVSTEEIETLPWREAK